MTRVISPNILACESFFVELVMSGYVVEPVREQRPTDGSVHSYFLPVPIVIRFLSC